MQHVRNSTWHGINAQHIGCIGCNLLRWPTCWFTCKLPCNGILVFFFDPGGNEPDTSSNWLLHVVILSIIIVLIFITTMIALRKQFFQKLCFKKSKWVLFMVTRWTECLQCETLLCPSGLQLPSLILFSSGLVYHFGLRGSFWWFSPRRKWL